MYKNEFVLDLKKYFLKFNKIGNFYFYKERDFLNQGKKRSLFSENKKSFSDTLFRESFPKEIYIYLINDLRLGIKI
jgi:hypothetical protein